MRLGGRESARSVEVGVQLPRVSWSPAVNERPYKAINRALREQVVDRLANVLDNLQAPLT